MTKIVFWPADYFVGGIPSAGLVLSEPVAGTVRVTWQANRGPDIVELYVRQHATNWPTLDGTSGGTLDPTYLVGSFYTPSQALRAAAPYPTVSSSPDQTSNVWTNTGYTVGQTVRAIALPRGRFGYNGARVFNSLVMQNAIGPALFFTGAGFLDDGLEDGIDNPGLDGTPIYAYQQITRSSAVSNSGHDIHVEVIDFGGNWVNADKFWALDGFGAVDRDTADIDEAAEVRSVNASLTPYLNDYVHRGLEPFTHLGMAIMLVPNGGGTPVDMLVCHYLWHTKLTP